MAEAFSEYGDTSTSQEMDVLKAWQGLGYYTRA